MKHLKKMASNAILEQVKTYQQLHLFDDAFSSATIASRLLQAYKSRPVIDKTEKIKTVRDAYNLIARKGDIFDTAVQDAIEHTDADRYSYISIDADILAKFIPDKPAKLHAFMTLMEDERDIRNADAYRSLMNDDDELLPFEEFEKALGSVYLKDVKLELANDLEYVDKTRISSLYDYFTDDVINSMLKQQVTEVPGSIDQEYYGELEQAIYDNMDNENKITIYRAISLPYSLKGLEAGMSGQKGVGIFWSYTSSGAVAHNGGGHGFELMLKAEVDVRNVNWTSTIYKAVYELAEEREIEVKEDVTVNVVGYTLKCDDVKRMVNSLDQYYFKELELSDEHRDTLKKNLAKLKKVKIKPITVKV